MPSARTFRKLAREDDLGTGRRSPRRPRHVVVGGYSMSATAVRLGDPELASQIGSDGEEDLTTIG